MVDNPSHTPFEIEISESQGETTRLKKAEETINKQNQLMKTLLDNLQVGVFMVEAPTGKPLFANQRAIDLLGRGIMNQADQHTLARQYNAYKYGTNELYPTDQMPIVSGLKGESHYIDDMVVVHPDGSTVRLEIFGTPVKDNSGHITGSLVSFSDITEKKQMEESLRQSEIKFRKVVENSPDLLYRTDMNGVIVFISPSVYTLSGYTIKEALGMKMAEEVYVNSEERAVFLELLSKKGFVRHFEALLRRKDGTTWWASTNAQFYRDEQGTILGVEGISRDVTELKRMQRQLKESENQYKQLSDASFEAVFLSEKGICISQNRSARMMFGYSNDEAVGMPATNWIHPDNRELTIRNIASGFEGVYQSRALRKDGSTFPCEIQARVIEQDGRNIRITALKDITDRIKAENEKLKAEKFRADQARHAMVGQLAGKMAHDFNNVLGVIMGNAQLAMIDCTESNIRETLQLILDQTLRGKNLTKNLVAFAKDQEPRQEYFKIHEKIDLVLDLLKKDLQSIQLIKEYQYRIPDILADPGMIEHALVNLIQNSIHALSRTKIPEILVRTYISDKLICFDIRDNGCGIPEDHIDNIYEPGFSLKGRKDETGAYGKNIKGAGYGMSNVKRYIEQHKGSITVRSAPGYGTKITVAIPLLEKQLTEMEQEKLVHSKPQTGKYILLVEDEQAIADVQYSILTARPLNHNVDMAATGQMAVDLLARNAYDLISLDYMLQGKLNGIDVYQSIRQTDKTIPILFISGNMEFIESIKELKQKDPYIDHLSKPCGNLEYVESINALIEKR